MNNDKHHKFNLNYQKNINHKDKNLYFHHKFYDEYYYIQCNYQNHSHYNFNL